MLPTPPTSGTSSFVMVVILLAKVVTSSPAIFTKIVTEFSRMVGSSLPKGSLLMLTELNF